MSSSRRSSIFSGLFVGNCRPQGETRRERGSAPRANRPQACLTVNVCWNGGRHGGAPEGTLHPIDAHRPRPDNESNNERDYLLRFCHPSLTSTAPSQTPCIQQQKRQRMEQMKKLGIGKFENQVGTPSRNPHAPSASTLHVGTPASFPRSRTHPPPFPVLTRRRIRTTTTPRAPDPRTTTPAPASQTTRGAPPTDGSKLRRRAR